MASKIATGTATAVVTAMMISCCTLNETAAPQVNPVSETFPTDASKGRVHELPADEPKRHCERPVLSPPERRDNVDAPVITDFYGTLGPENVWTFHGTVTDVDGDPEGWQVTFGGVLASASPVLVAADGTFVLIIELSESVSGDATAQIVDELGLLSNQAAYFVGV